MDNLVEKDESAPEKRSVRRRLVQSTLFPNKSQEIESNCGDQKTDKDCEVGGDNEDDQDNCCGSQGKKTRKRKGKATPTSTKAPRKLKEKSPKKTTPRKTTPRKTTPRKTTPKKTTPNKSGASNGKISSNLMESVDASPQIPNLMLEAKSTAEELSRMFAGKQMHPFFSSWKAGKKNQEMTETDTNRCLVERKDKRITIGPIHVFERIQDEAASIDWRNWTFSEKSLTDSSCWPEGPISSVFEGSVESLKFDKFRCVQQPYDLNKVSLDHSCIEEHLSEPSPAVPVSAVDDHEALCQLVNSLDGDHQLEQVAFVSRHAGSIKKCDFEEKSRFLQERIMPHHNGLGNQFADSLWTDKYQPKNAMEVCGNSDSVKLMSEWLHLWKEKDFRASKDSHGSDKCSMQDLNKDYYETDSDSENTDEGDRLKNVLLVTGPVGSGKSAAIHACASEKGFKVLENNASDQRHGAFVKQRFGEALESHRLNRSLGNPVDSQSKNIMRSTQFIYNGEEVEPVDDEVIEMIHTSAEENSHGIYGTSGEFVCKERIIDRTDVKTLILFEDVDMFFPEDRGFIAAVQQIAEKAKGPVILTSNGDDNILPDNLDRLEVSFAMPSPKDLLSHLYKICAAEKVDIQPHLIEQLIGCCHGDIRKTIMHLQFWCQSKKYGKDKNMQKMYGPLLFDPETGHQILPKIIHWGFPSQLSELVEKEITKSLSLMEENSTFMEVIEEEGHKEMLSREYVHHNETDNIEAKKEAMLSRNGAIPTSYEFADPLDNACEFSNFPGTPVSFVRPNIRRKLNVVMSSDSEDEPYNGGFPVVADGDTNILLFPEDDSRFPSQVSNTQMCTNPLSDQQVQSEAEKYEVIHYQWSEMENGLPMNGTCKSVDMSCVPESSFVAETEIDNGAELLSGAVCSGYFAESVEVSFCNELIHSLAPVEAGNKSVMLHKSSDMSGNICDVIAESSHGEEVQDSQNEHLETLSRGYQVMDECSRMDFKRRSKPMEKLTTWVAKDLVKESWERLRGSNTDLKQYVASEKADAFQIVQLAHGMCKLISEADLLLSKCQTRDFLELSTFPSEESDAFSWCDEHLQMTSTIVQHGFCSYVKDISTRGLNMGSDTRVDLTQEMLASTTNMMALGELSGPGVEASRTSQAGSCSEISPPKSEILLESETKSCLFNSMRSIVPLKRYLSLKGQAFHEYISSLGSISRSEATRLSEGIKTTNKRRARGSRHYLSTGALSLSPEDISLLGQSSLYGKTSSQLKDGSN